MTSALTTLQQALLFAGTLLVVGCVAWRVRVMPGALRDLTSEEGVAFRGIERRVLALALGSTFLLAVAWGLRLVVQVMGFRDPFVPLWDDVSFLLFEIFWGSVWMTQGIVLTLLGGAIWLAGRRHGPAAGEAPSPGPGVGWTAAAVMAVALVATLALSGHAMGADSGRAIAVAADAVHTLAAGCWIGSLAVILFVARSPAGGPPDGSGPRLFAAQLRAFSPLALVGGSALVAMGVILSWTHLHAVSDLWSAAYGRLLSAKIALALVIFGLGFWNWRHGLAVCDTISGAAAVRRRASLEVSLAVGVILITAVLVHASRP